MMAAPPSQTFARTVRGSKQWWTGTITSTIKVNYTTALADNGPGYADGNLFQATAGQVTFTPTGSHTATASVIIYPESKPLPTNDIFDMVLSIPTGQTGYTLGTSIGIGTIDD